jgi:hypothetical protein
VEKAGGGHGACTGQERRQQGSPMWLGASEGGGGKFERRVPATAGSGDGRRWVAAGPADLDEERGHEA